MNKTEALRAALDGHRVTNKCWHDKAYFYWDGSHFRDYNQDIVGTCGTMRWSDGWKIYDPRVPLYGCNIGQSFKYNGDTYIRVVCPTHPDKDRSIFAIRGYEISQFDLNTMVEL